MEAILDIEGWLSGLGLERYVKLFATHEVDSEVLPRLTDAHLQELGVPLGPRLKLLDAIARLRAETGAPAGPPLSSTPSGAAASKSAGRRQLTVMFVDLVGSTALSARLDPEEMSEILLAYRNAVAEAIARFGGHVAKYMGDGVLAYFGWPASHEHEAERAVKAGLAVASAIASLATRAPEPLSARVGIATGPVVVGDLVGTEEARERSVVGNTPNLAARLQGLADAGSVIVADATRRLLGNLFAYRELGPLRLKGFADPVVAYLVLGEGTAESRFEAMHSACITPLVGRDHELALLLGRWNRVMEGEGQVVLLSGEAGIGKSRLVRSLREQLFNEAHTTLGQFCSPYHGNTALHSAIGCLERAAALQREDPPEVKLEKLESMLKLSGQDVREAASLLSDLLSIPRPGRYPELSLSPQQKKERTFQVLLDQLSGLSARGPVLALYEDVHWADPTTLELLERVVDRVQRLPVLVLVTCRPGFIPGWAGHGHVTSLSLGRLGRQPGLAMIEQVTGKPLPSEVLEQILARTDGVPLFVEELTKAVLESGLLVDHGDRYELEGPLPPLAIPATLHDSLMNRLDRLAPTREVAQLAACIGREFSYELLAAAFDGPPLELDRALADLTGAELVFSTGAPSKRQYTFKHALVQDAAYQSLLKSRRQSLHAKIAMVLEKQFPEVAEAQPEVLARHCAEAGLIEQATEHLLRAANQCVATWAMEEAIAHLRHALEMLAGLPDGEARRRRELDLRMAMGIPLMAIRGAVFSEVEETYRRARELCRQLGDSPRLFSVLFGLWWFYELTANLSSALALAKQLLEMAEPDDKLGQLAQAHRTMACTRFWMGDFAGAQPHFHAATTLQDPAVGYGPSPEFAQDPAVVARCFAAHNLWFLGYPDRALAAMDEAVSFAKELNHPFTLAIALDHKAWLRHYRRDVVETADAADTDIRFSRDQGLKFFLAHGMMFRGWAMVEQGDLAGGRAQMLEGIGTHDATGVLVTRPYWRLLLAAADAGAGNAEEGERLWNEASALMRDQRLWDAEMLRTRGELLVGAHDTPGVGWANRALSPDAHQRLEQAQHFLSQAVDVARKQNAKSLELRASVSLAKLWERMGKPVEARQHLEAIMGWFTEGFDTEEYVDATETILRLNSG